MTEETDALRDPTDADLRAWLAEHPDVYRLDPRFAFRQLLVSRDRHGDDAEGDARALLCTARRDRPRRCSRRRGGRDPAAARCTPVVAGRDRGAQFGEGFAAALAETATGEVGRTNRVCLRPASRLRRAARGPVAYRTSTRSASASQTTGRRRNAGRRSKQRTGGCATAIRSWWIERHERLRDDHDVGSAGARAGSRRPRSCAPAT